MIRTSYRSWVLGVTLLCLLAAKHVLAIGPSYVMFYGGQLNAPIVQALPIGSATFLWNTHRPGGTIPKSLEGRTYVKYAIFWGRWEKKSLTPEGASQHGRLYLPTASEPGVVVLTDAVMDDGSPSHPAARPIPVELGGFKMGWPVNADDLATARRLGVPGL